MEYRPVRHLQGEVTTVNHGKSLHRHAVLTPFPYLAAGSKQRGKFITSSYYRVKTKGPRGTMTMDCLAILAMLYYHDC